MMKKLTTIEVRQESQEKNGSVGIEQSRLGQKGIPKPVLQKSKVAELLSNQKKPRQIQQQVCWRGPLQGQPLPFLIAEVD